MTGAVKGTRKVEADGVAAGGSEGAVFVSYARKDEKFVAALSDDLQRTGQPTWVDEKGIRPTADWMREVKAAILEAPAFVFVISPESARSKICREEIDYAVSVNKRILPVVSRKVPSDKLPDAIASRNWISLRAKGGRAAGINALKRAIDTDPEWAAAHTRLLVRAQEWEQGGRDSSLALRGQDLSAAERWLSEADDRKDPQPTRLQTDLILESRRLTTRVQRTRTIALAVGMAVALGLAAYALVQRGQAEQRAQEARSRELAATAVAQADNNPQLGLLLALEAAETERTDEAESSLRQTLDSSYGRAALSGDQGPLNSAVLSNDGNRAVTGGEGGTVVVWDLPAREQVARVAPGGVLTDVAISPDEELVAASTTKGAVGLWEAEGGRRVRLLRRPGGGSAESVAFSSDGGRVIATGLGSASTWASGGRPLETLRGHRGIVYSGAFEAGGSRVVTAGEDGTARIWQDGRQVRVLGRPERPGMLRPDTNSAVFSPDGERVLTSSDDGRARVWNAETGELEYVLPASDAPTYTAEFSSDGSRVLTGSLDGSARIWAVPGEGVGSGRAELLLTLRSPSGEVRSAAFGPGDTSVITAHSDGLARIWRPGRGDVERTLPHPATHEVLDVAYAPVGDEVLTAATDGLIRRWSAESGEPVGPPLRQFQPLSVEVSQDGRRMVTTGNDGSVRVWMRDDNEPRALDSPLSVANSAAFDPGGDRVVAVGEEGGRIWDLGTDDEFVDLQGEGPLFSVAFSPNGDKVATVGAAGEVRLWDSDSGEPREQLKGHRGSVVGVAFSPDGETLATAGIEDRTARLWDLDSGEATAILSAHSAGVYGVAFSPDGERLATSAADRTVRVWDTSSGEPLDTLRGPRDEIDAVAYSPDGRRLLAASRDGNAYLLRCDICIPYEELLREAHARVSRALTPEERDAYLREFE